MTTKHSKSIVKCVVFDLDGTLLNTIKTINYYLNQAMTYCGLDILSEKDTMRFVGNGASKLVERAINRVGADRSVFDSVFAAYNERYNSDPYYLTEIYEGIVELLSELKNKGIKLAVLSNKPDYATALATRRFFPDIFDIIRGGREGVALKPEPDSLLEIMSELNIGRDEIAYVGDSEVDVITAQNAEISNGIFVTWGFRTREKLIDSGASLLVDKPREIIDIIFS